MGLLKSYLEYPDLEWDGVYYLREVCLGRPIEPEQTRTLVREQLLRDDGSVDPAMQAVVLSAVRGEGRVLHIESPFTAPLDRSVAEYLIARDYVRSHFDDANARAIFNYDPVGRTLDLLPRPKTWTGREDDRTDPPGEPGTAPR